MTDLLRRHSPDINYSTYFGGEEITNLIQSVISLQEFILQIETKKNTETAATMTTITMLLISVSLVIYLLILALKGIYENLIKVWF